LFVRCGFPDKVQHRVFLVAVAAVAVAAAAVVVVAAVVAVAAAVAIGRGVDAAFVAVEAVI
jgi:hypothetical protein